MASHFPENGGHRSSERTVVLHEIVRRRIIKLNVAVVSAWDHRRHLDGGKGLKMSPNICLSNNSFFWGGGVGERLQSWWGANKKQDKTGGKGCVCIYFRDWLKSIPPLFPTPLLLEVPNTRARFWALVPKATLRLYVRYQCLSCKKHISFHSVVSQ